MSPTVNLLVILLISPVTLASHSCSCLHCGGSLEIYSGTNLLLRTDLTMVGLRNITHGADQVYLLGCGCFMIFSGDGQYGRAQKIREDQKLKLKDQII